MTDNIALDEVILNDPNFYAHQDFHTYFKRFRAENPVYWFKGKLRRGFWAVFKYGDVMNICRDVNTFSSQRNGVGVPTSAEDDDGANPSTGAVLMTTDPPLHIAMRKAYREPFLPRAIGSLEGRARKLVAEIIDDILPRGECDFAVDIANRLPMTIAR